MKKHLVTNIRLIYVCPIKITTVYLLHSRFLQRFLQQKYQSILLLSVFLQLLMCHFGVFSRRGKKHTVSGKALNVARLALDKNIGGYSAEWSLPWTTLSACGENHCHHVSGSGWNQARVWNLVTSQNAWATTLKTVALCWSFSFLFANVSVKWNTI